MKIFKLSFLFAALFYAAGAFAQTQQIFMVEVLFNNGQVKIGEVINGQGYAQEPEIESVMGPYRYWLELISLSGETLEMRKFSFSQRIIAPRPLRPGETPAPAVKSITNEFNKIITLPYYSDVKLLKIYDLNKNLLDQKDVSFLIPGCGDGNCGNKENYSTCASDCPAAGQDDYCNPQESVNDPDCPDYNKPSAVNNSAKTGSIFSSKLFYIIYFVLLLAVILIFYYIYKKRWNNEEL